jgi:2-haloacid dehalogenase
MKKYHGFVFDADNTLFDFHRAERSALFETLQAVPGFIYSEQAYIIYRRINDTLWRALEKGEQDIESLKQLRFRRFLQSLDLEGDPARLSVEYLARLSEKDFLLPHALEVLEILSRKASLLLLTNGLAQVQRGRIVRAGVEIFFEDIIISEEVGLAKPDPSIFMLAVDSLKLPPYEILSVGDNPFSDIGGAQQAGLDTCLFLDPLRKPTGDDPQPDYMINDLRELTAFAADTN